MTLRITPSIPAAAQVLVRQGVQAIPALSWSQHKGSSGRVAVVGGSEDYSGAPYLAAMAAMRCGADLAFVLCPPSVAPVIKTYAPDLVVRGILVEERLEEVLHVIDSCHAVLVGPGMGTAAATQRIFDALLSGLTPPQATVSDSTTTTMSPRYRIPVVLDACALRLILNSVTPPQTNDVPGDVPPCVNARYLGRRFVLTPNAVEFSRLAAVSTASHTTCATRLDDIRGSSSPPPIVSDVAATFRATVVRKGNPDVVSSVFCLEEGSSISSADVSPPEVAVTVPEFGSPRRAGGQGDVFCGSVAAFLAFQFLAPTGGRGPGTSARGDQNPSAAVAAASVLVKVAAAMAFDRPGGSTFIASDLLPLLGQAREALLSEFGGEVRSSTQARSGL